MKVNKSTMLGNELRIGNLVYYIGIKYDPDGNKLGTCIRYIVEAEDIKSCITKRYKFEPIPITEKRLLELGLTKEDTLFTLPKEIRDLCKGDKGRQCPSVFFNNRLNRWMDTHTRVCFDSVHKFQNLVYELTGEELKPNSTTKQLI